MRTLKYVIGVVSFSLLLVFACSKPATLDTDNSISAIQVFENTNDITATVKSLTIGKTADASGNYPISFTLPAGAKVENINIKYLINPKAKLVTDLTNLKYQANTPTIIEVQSQSGTKRKYSVTISIEQVKASTKKINSFIFKKTDNTALTEDKVATIDQTAKTITVTLPNGTAVTSLKPTIEHDGMSVEPQSGVAQDFTAVVNYEVTAQDGTKQDYTVNVVTVAKSSAKSITSFKFTKTDNSTLPEDQVATIDQTAKTITVTVPFSTMRNGLVPTIEHNGTRIEPQSGVAQDFTAVINYEVTAQDGTKQTYAVRVTVAENKPTTKPVLTAPANDAKDLIRSEALTFTWSAATDPEGGAVSYSIIVYEADGTGAAKTDVAVFNETTQSLSHTFVSGSFDYNKIYFWKVVAKDNGNLTSESDPLWKFTIKANQPPSKAMLTSPANQATNVNPVGGKFQWTQSTDPEGETVSYTLYLGTDNPPTSSQDIGNKLEVGFKDVMPNPLNRNTTYYWYIKATAGSLSSQTEVSSFTTSQVSFAIKGYYAADNTRIGAGDMNKPGLIQIDIADGNHDYSINGNTGTFTATNSLGTINGKLEFFQTAGTFIADGLMKITIDRIEYNLGTKEQYKVRTPADLSAFRLDLGGTYTLENDIELPPVDGTQHPELASDYATSGWVPIGNQAEKFTGSFDGKEHTISKLNIERSSTNYVGLFGYTSGGTLKNIGIMEGHVTGQSFIGVLVGQSESSIDNCYAIVDITGLSYVGGLLGNGEYRNNVSNCYAKGNVNGYIYLGGLVGQFSGFSTNVVKQCYATGDVTVTVSGGGGIGGLIGFLSVGQVINCYAKGNVTGGAGGGLVGKLDGSCENSYAIGNVTGTATTGGLFGYGSGEVTKCYWDTVTSGKTVLSSTDNGTDFGKTTAQMTDASTYVDWNFTDIWAIDATINAGYPYLIGVGGQQ